MLIEDIQCYDRPMRDLIDYLKKHKYDITTFFTKFELAYQYIIINQFLIEEYNMVMMITPKVIGIKEFTPPHLISHTLLFIEKVDDLILHIDYYYAKLIIESFKHIDKSPF